MNQRTERRVNVSMSGIGLMIGLTWFEGQGDKLGDMRAIHLEYSDGIVMDSVQKALDMLVPDWSKVYTYENRMSVVSPRLDDDPELFDFITNAEEPEQAFISRNVLEYHDGKPAYMRKWEKEFAEKYNHLLELASFSAVA
jgi:hypothetical protein